jgi:hypothetical protein
MRGARQFNAAGFDHDCGVKKPEHSNYKPKRPFSIPRSGGVILCFFGAQRLFGLRRPCFGVRSFSSYSVCAFSGSAGLFSRDLRFQAGIDFSRLWAGGVGVARVL